MNAVMFALDTWGFEKVVTVGVHLTHRLYEGYQSAWWPLKSTDGHRVRGIGGWVEQYFGKPDKKFLGGCYAG